MAFRCKKCGEIEIGEPSENTFCDSCYDIDSQCLSCGWKGFHMEVGVSFEGEELVMPEQIICSVCPGCGTDDIVEYPEY